MPALPTRSTRAVERHLATAAARRRSPRASWRGHGAIIIVADWDEAVALIDRIAPEHLELALDDADALAAQVRHAGAIFLGRHTPEAIGDYVAGPNHVLPTARSARFASGLGVLDFMKRTLAARAAMPASLARSARRRSRSPRPKGWTRTRCRSPSGSICRAAERQHGRCRPAHRRDHPRRAHASSAAAPTSSTSARWRSSTCSRRTSFAPVSGCTGPFHLHLGIEENRLIIDIRATDETARSSDRCCRSRRSAASSKTISWSARAITRRSATASPAQIEAIDMGRRALAQRGLGAAARAARRARSRSISTRRGACSR